VVVTVAEISVLVVKVIVESEMVVRLLVNVAEVLD
jgi:hypothetical protein